MLRPKESYPLEDLHPNIKSTIPLDSCTQKNGDYSSNDTTCKTKPPAKHKPFLGFFYAFLTSVLITLTSVFVKKLSYIDPGQLSFVRNSAVFAGCLPIAVYSTKEVLGSRKDWPLLLLRGFLGANALYLHLTAYRYLPLAEAAVVMSSTPALTTIIAHFYIKESCGKVQILGLVITFCGVLLSVRLPELLSNRSTTHFDSAYIGGLAAAVGCVLILSFTFVLLRKMREIHFSIPLLYFGFLGSIENGIINFAASPVMYPECGWDQVFVLLIGVFGFMGHCTLTLAFQAEAAGIVTVIKASLDIIVAIFFQIIFFSAVLNVYNITGALLVILSVSLLGFSKWLRMLPDESRTKKRFKYFLL